MELGQQVLDPLLLARQCLDHLAQLGHLGLRGLLGVLCGQRELVQALFPGVALPGEVFNGHGLAEHLLRVAAGEEREGLVRRAAHIARRGEPGELVVCGGELSVHPLRPVGGRLGVGFRPAEHLKLTAVLLGQLGRLVLQLRHGRRGAGGEPASRAISRQGGRRHGPGRRGQQRACDNNRSNPTPAAQSAAKPASGNTEPALGGVPAAHQLTSPSAGPALTHVTASMWRCELRRTIAARSRHMLAIPPITAHRGPGRHRYALSSRAQGVVEAVEDEVEPVLVLAAVAHRYDVIIDIGGNRPLGQLRGVLARRGTLVIVGGETGGRWLGGFDRSLRAPVLSRFVPQRLAAVMVSENAADLLALAKLIESGQVTPVIDRTYPLSQAPDAIRYVQQGHARGKVVITV